jgi:hypothetical protein
MTHGNISTSEYGGRQNFTKEREPKTYTNIEVFVM